MDTATKKHQTRRGKNNFSRIASKRNEKPAHALTDEPCLESDPSQPLIHIDDLQPSVKTLIMKGHHEIVEDEKTSSLFKRWGQLIFKSHLFSKHHRF